MNWIEALYQTYESNATAVGKTDAKVPLLPVGHTTQMAHVTITIDEAGNFLRAEVIPRSEARTIIPASERSAGRTSGLVPHPLCDKLQYVAADYEKHAVPKKPCYQEYVEAMEGWCTSPHSHPKVCAVLNYVRKGSLIADLVKAKTLHVNEDGLLKRRTDFDARERPEIFDVLPNASDQADTFVRFAVEVPGDSSAHLWSDPHVWESWDKYYRSIKTTRGLCFVTGEDASLAEQHPAKIRNDGDKSKLISSNDESGFTFRGRFIQADEACGVGYVVTQKAHSALRWLISRQGHSGEQSCVAWAISGAEIPDPFADTLAVVAGAGQDSQALSSANTAQELGLALSKLMAGYTADLGATDDIVVMGLDSATPGRMSITFYRELTGAAFLERVLGWHRDCAWHQDFGKDRQFAGAPSPRAIAEAAYGRELPDRLRTTTIRRLLPCIIDGNRIPRDLVDSCVRRASKRHAMDDWEWKMTLGVACAVYRHQNRERDFCMALEHNRTTRDYLYGRLLALADYLEAGALRTADEKRPTNAARLMQRFAERPYTTWLTIETSLTPYRLRLRSNAPGLLVLVEKGMDEVMALFDADEFASDRGLAGEFLLGYHCQRRELYAKPEEAENSIDTEQ